MEQREEAQWEALAAERRRESRWKKIAPVFCFLGIPWIEALLRLADADSAFFGLGLLRSLFAGAAVGSLLWLAAVPIPRKGIARGIVFGVLFFVGAVAIAQRCCRAFFGAYFQLGFLTGMTGQVAGDFLGTALSVILRNLWFFPLALAPAVLFAIFRKRLVPQQQEGRSTRARRRLASERRGLGIAAGVCAVVFQILTVVLCHVGGDIRYYTVDYSANSAIPRFGLVNTLRLEVQYGLFGMPEAKLSYQPPDTQETVQPEEPEPAPEEPDQSGGFLPADSSGEAPAEEPEPIVYGDNVMDIDFEGLMASDSGNLLAMDQYFSAQTPTKQNEYTGMFEGKNLILITAEAFSPAVIDPERTPALYELANSGFVFSNYYQPDWTQSTTGGEFAVMTGIIPTWVGSSPSFSASVGKAMPFALGWQFQELGYNVHAYHNNSYTYYKRDQTHPNLGYPFTGIGNGLELANPDLWPGSDLEMMQATIDQQIQDYLDTGTPFHTYYMTVSGHCNYGFGVNHMSQKNEAITEGMEASETVRAYLACQQELEYAMEYLMDALEEAGIADDTVIALSADHYPYAMSEGDTDYYPELTGVQDTTRDTSRYRNTLILWCGEMEEPVMVDTPCSAIDIVPTLSNLFGLEYDSRLLSGRDILAPDVAAGQVGTDMHLVIFADSGYGNSWISAAGTYEAYTDTFTPNEGVQVGEDYVSQVNRLLQDRYTYARYLIDEDYYRHLFPDAP